MRRARLANGQSAQLWNKRSRFKPWGGGGGGGGVIVFVLEKGTLYSHSASVLPGLASLLGGSSNTPDRFMLLMLEICAALIGY